MIKHQFKYYILIFITLLIAGCAVFLPDFLIHKEIDSHYDKVNDVPSDYYSGPSESIIKNASTLLTTEQCLQLISGVWDSEIRPVSSEDCNITDFGIKTLTVAHVNGLYTKGLYPCSLSSDTDNWYAWEAKPYRALDKTFRTYAAYFWDITFTKYDNSETHRFIVSENGDILYAEATTKESFGSFSPKLSNSSYLLDNFISTSYTTSYIIDDDNDSAETTGLFTTVTSDNTYKRYSTEEVSATSPSAKKIEEQINSASSFINDYEAFTPDSMVTLSQTGGSMGRIKYSVASKTEKDSYKLILLPELQQ